MTSWLCVDDAELIVKAAFAPWAARYRATVPDLKEKIDSVRSRPNRTEQESSTRVLYLEYTGPTAECPRCGDDFPTRGQKHARFCSPECHDEHREWCKRTGRRFYLRKDVRDA